MQGANEYYDLFIGCKELQFGRLYLSPGLHARGPTFEIYLLPEGVKCGAHPLISAWHCKESVEVYGMVGGQRGWTEYYGWIHKGKWQEDFEKIVEERVRELALKKEKHRQSVEASKLEKKEKIQSLLEDY